MNAPRTCCEYHRLTDEGKRHWSNRPPDEGCWDAIEIAEHPVLDLLRRCRALLERVRRLQDGCCPFCAETVTGHESDCELAALLTELRALGEGSR